MCKDKFFSFPLPLHLSLSLPFIYPFLFNLKEEGIDKDEGFMVR
jgi:hypothetical protein